MYVVVGTTLSYYTPCSYRSHQSMHEDNQLRFNMSLAAHFTLTSVDEVTDSENCSNIYPFGAGTFTGVFSLFISTLNVTDNRF